MARNKILNLISASDRNKEADLLDSLYESDFTIAAKTKVILMETEAKKLEEKIRNLEERYLPVKEKIFESGLDESYLKEADDIRLSLTKACKEYSEHMQNLQETKKKLEEDHEFSFTNGEIRTPLDNKALTFVKEHLQTLEDNAMEKANICVAALQRVTDNVCQVKDSFLDKAKTMGKEALYKLKEPNRKAERIAAVKNIETNLKTIDKCVSKYEKLREEEKSRNPFKRNNPFRKKMLDKIESDINSLNEDNQKQVGRYMDSLERTSKELGEIQSAREEQGKEEHKDVETTKELEDKSKSLESVVDRAIQRSAMRMDAADEKAEINQPEEDEPDL